MSLECQRRVRASTRSTKVARAVLLEMADFARGAEPPWHAWPAIETLASATGWSKRAVQNALRELEHLGEIVPLEGTGRGGARTATTRYELLAFTHAGGAPVGTTRGAGDARVGVQEVPRGVQETTARGAGGAPKPGRNQEGNRVDEMKRPALALPDGAPAPAVDDETRAIGLERIAELRAQRHEGIPA